MTVEEIIRIIRDYQFDQECIMDACKYVGSPQYQYAEAKWNVLDAVIGTIYKELKLKERTENRK